MNSRKPKCQPSQGAALLRGAIRLLEQDIRADRKMLATYKRKLRALEKRTTRRTKRRPTR